MKIARTIDFVLALVWGVFLGFSLIEYLTGFVPLPGFITVFIAVIVCALLVHKVIWKVYEGTRIRKIDGRRISFPE